MRLSELVTTALAAMTALLLFAHPVHALTVDQIAEVAAGLEAQRKVDAAAGDTDAATQPVVWYTRIIVSANAARRQKCLDGLQRLRDAANSVIGTADNLATQQKARAQQTLQDADTITTALP